MSSSQFEWDLLAGRAPSEGPSRARELGKALAEADFAAVLLSDETKGIFGSQAGLSEGLLSHVAASGGGPTATADTEVQLVIAIALLHAFVQANWTGPDLTFSPSQLLPSASSSSGGEDLESRAIPLLTLNGEPAYHLASHPSLFVLSLRLLASLSSSSSPPPTLVWWLLRAHLVHLALLDDPVALPSSTLSAITALEAGIPPAEQDLRTSLHIELGKYHHALGNDKVANQEFLAAAKASELQYELTGALGRKTKYQVHIHSQLVLLAESRKRDGEEVAVVGEKGEQGAASNLPETLALNDDTLLEETEFTKTTVDPTSTSPLSHIDPANQPALHPLDQTLLLGLCLNTHNSLPSSGLTSSQMMPFIHRVVTHPRNWSIHTTALLLRSRLEADRSRTVERSTLQLAALIDQMPTSDSAPQERLAYFHQLPLPSRWEMERELAKRYMTVGVTRSALEIFGRLEMWEDAVGCLQRMERESEAEKIVRDLLEGKKVESDVVSSLARVAVSEDRKVKMGKAREGKLWCLLGDITLGKDEASRDPRKAKEEAAGYYEKAWEVSGGTSSRSRRSLGSLLVSAGEWEKAIPVLQAAGAINPLYARVWFTLGVCFVRLERWVEARDAFQRQVSVDEEDGEGWNNLAAVYLRLQEDKRAAAGDGDVEEVESKSSAFDNKLLAFRALRTGLKFSPTNWRMWANYMLIAIDVGELAESARAMSRLMEEQSATMPVDMDVLDKLVDSVTRDDWNGGSPAAPVTTSNEGFGLLPIVERLFDTVILPRVSDDARLWRCHARLLRWKEDWGGAMDDYLKAYRVGPVSDQAAERGEGRFKEAAREVEELVGVLEGLGPRAKEKGRKGDWRFTAKGIVRTFMGRTKDMFEETAEWEKLKELLEELKRPE